VNESVETDPDSESLADCFKSIRDQKDKLGPLIEFIETAGTLFKKYKETLEKLDIGEAEGLVDVKNKIKNK